MAADYAGKFLMTRRERLASDAKIVLEKAGYGCQYERPFNARMRREIKEYLVVFPKNGPYVPLQIISGCVDNAEVKKLLEEMKAK
jgi:hypothetical protein